MFCVASNTSSENIQVRENGSFSRAKTGFSSDVNSTLGPNISPGGNRNLGQKSSEAANLAWGVGGREDPSGGCPLSSGLGVTVLEIVLTRRGGLVLEGRGREEIYLGGTR